MKVLILAATAAIASTTFAQTSLVVPAGTTLVYDTADGPLLLQDLTIESGATLRALGLSPFRVHALGTVRVDGTIDLSAFSSNGVSTLNTTNIPEPGAAGGPGGGRGGTGNPLTTQASLSGDPGFGPPAALRVGGRGGEAGVSMSHPGVDQRRPGGGGGGALAADQPVHPDPLHVSNRGRIAEPGRNGWPTALGGQSLSPPPQGGAVGDRVFVDGDPTNDFFGVRLMPGTGLPQLGELTAPVAGSGGGGGGNAIFTPVWPPVFIPTGDEKGAGGGGGGGLGILVASRIVLGVQGKIRCDGGAGGGGENTLFLNRVGGGSGGGSGGYLLLQARSVDLSQAQDNALTALGGRGGVGKDNQFAGINSGGNGGPGVISIHLPALTMPALPAGKTLADISAPTAFVLLPDRRL